MQQQLKIAVVGCGPGGMAVALLLHRAGHEVALFEQFDRPQPIGSGLLIQPSGQHVLGELGMLGAIRSKAAPVTGLHGINVHNGKRALDVEYRYLGEGAMALGIHRASLFETLYDAVQAEGIPVQTGRTLLSIGEDADRCYPRFEQGEEQRFDFCINATGARNMLSGGESRVLPYAALWTTVDAPPDSEIAVAALDQRYWKSSRMAGIMPVGVNPETGNLGAALFWSIKPGEMGALRERGIEKWREDFLSLWPDADPFVRQVESFDQLKLAIYRHRTGSPVSGGRIFHIGDAWHCTSPQLGQGANMALIDALALSDAIKRADDIAEIPGLYRYMRSDHVKLYQLLSCVFTPLYQSDSIVLPMIRDTIIHYFGRLAGVRSLTAHVVSGNLGNWP